MVYDSVTEQVDILILTKVIDIGDDAVQSTSALTPVWYPGIVYYNKKDKEK